MPFTNCVLPAPNSPERAMTCPRRAARPNFSPSASVSAGLCEMSVAMRVQFVRAVPVAECDALAGDNFPDAAQLQFREFFLPGVQQFHRVPGGYREHQFKVLAVRQG